MGLGFGFFWGPFGVIGGSILALGIYDLGFRV